jgi:hypothetical protein
VHPCGSRPTSTTISATKFCVAMAGDANPAAQCPTLRFTTRSFAASPAMIRKRTLLRFAPHATPPCIADNKDREGFKAGLMAFEGALEASC